MARVYLAGESLASSRHDCYVIRRYLEIYGAINCRETRTSFSEASLDAAGMKAEVEFRAKYRLLLASSVRAPVECDEGIHSAAQRSSLIHREPGGCARDCPPSYCPPFEKISRVFVQRT